MKEKYNEMIRNNDFNSLANIYFIGELCDYKYEGRYLLEYLLEKNIHSVKMDNEVVYNTKFISLYLKYNIIEPLLKCSIISLLKEENNELLLDKLLSKLNNQQKIILYDNIRLTDYNNYRINEKIILESFKKHGITLPSIFIDQPVNNNEYPVRMEDLELINRLKETFKDQSDYVLNIYINEFKKRLLVNHERTVFDIERLMEHKINNPKFKLAISPGTEGRYIYDDSILEISHYSSIIFDHELSHLLFQIFENDEIINEYEKIRVQIDNKKNYKIIQKYLKVFHDEYKKKKKDYEKEYYSLINDKYGNFDNYLMLLCKDFYNNKDKMKTFILNVAIFDLTYCNSIDSVKDVIIEFLETEKNEFINNRVRSYYGAKLMLENLLDALMVGKIFDDPNDEGLSGHSTYYFDKDERNSFDECLANFDAICKSNEKDELIRDLETLVGSELIKFLENYLEKNRKNKYGNR